MAGSVRVLVLTDLEGSTRLWAEHPAVMVDVMAEHHAIVHAAIAAYGGTRPADQGEGDAVFASFAAATDAVAAVLRFQRELEEHVWPEAIALRDRVGVHVGEVVERDGNLFGIAVSRAARIRSLAAGGQVLLSAGVVDLVDGRLPEGATTSDLGLHRLKDLTRPERIHQLDGPGLRSGFAPLASLDRLPNNLPTERWPLVGRDEDVRDLAALVGDERLVTVVGFGGMGKTRLALQVAAELLDGSGDGVWFVDLAGTEDAAAIPAAILAAVGAEEGTGTAEDALHTWAGARTVLLVLDNLEQLLPDAAPILDGLLDAGSGVHVLATSREPIRIDGERVWALAPLATDASVRLLVDRATAVRREFVLTPETQPVVEAICARLEGSPLAIELAAARLRAMSPEALLARLDRALPVLTGGSRSLPARQQTVRATIEWSTRSLDPAAADLLESLSVFPGSFDLAAAEAVHADRDVVLDALTELVDRSLVQVVDEEEGGDRYRLLVPIREFAAERLARSEQEDAVRDRHAWWFAGLVLLPPDWSVADQAQLDLVVRSDWHNVRAALNRLHRIGARDDEIALAPWLAISLLLEGRSGDGFRLLLHAADHLAPGESTPAAAMLLSLLARYHFLTYRETTGREPLRIAHDLVASVGDDALRIYIASLNTRHGDVLGIDPAAAVRAGEMLQALPATGNSVPRWFLERIWTTAALGAEIVGDDEVGPMVDRLLAHADGEVARARVHYDVANALVGARRFDVARPLAETFLEADHLALLPPMLRPNAISVLADLEIGTGRFAVARDLLGRARALAGPFDDPTGDLLITIEEAAVDRGLGDPQQAVLRLESLLADDELADAGPMEATARWLLAVIAREGGDDAIADASLRAAWRIAERESDREVIRACLLERAVQSGARSPGETLRWVRSAAAGTTGPVVLFGVRYDVDALVARDGGVAEDPGPLVLPPW